MFDHLRRETALDAIRKLGYFETVLWLDQTDSTNRFVDREIKSGKLPFPCLVVADRQTAGSGRGGNQWYSPPGCLMFSMAVPNRPLEQRPALLPLEVGVTLARAITPLVRSRPKVKWPNDVTIEDRKVAGILIESYGPHRQAPKGSVDGYTIIGVGVNCQVSFEQASEEVRRCAVSLHEFAKPQEHELRGTPDMPGVGTTSESVLIDFLTMWFCLQREYEDEPGWVTACWPDWDWLGNRWIQVQQPHQTLIGRADGIDLDGSLRLIDAAGNLHTILSGTVRPIE